jgi:hypothetical protein
MRWDERAGLRTGCSLCSQVIDVLEAQIIKETGKISTAVAKQNRNFSQQKQRSKPSL